MDPGLLDIMACPVCKGPLLYRPDGRELVCRADGLAWLVREGVPHLRVADAREISQPEFAELECR